MTSNGQSGSKSPVGEGTIMRGFLAKMKSIVSDDEEDDFSTRNGHLSPEEASAQRNKESEFRKHPFFLMELHLKEGRDLVIRDSNGTSDPYVKFKQNGKVIAKSRTLFKNLNPNWNERITIPIEDPFKPVQLRVFDYDKGLNDDTMGGCEFLPTSLDINKAQDFKLQLSEKESKKKGETMGYVTFSATIAPKSQDEKEAYFKKTGGKPQGDKKLKTQVWSGVVTIVLVEGIDLLAMDDNGFSDPYVRVRIGEEKFKSKHKQKTLNPRWLEMTELRMFDTTNCELEVSVWDHDTAGKDDIMGRAVVDITALKTEQTHRLKVELEDGAGIVHMMLTVTGTQGTDSVSDLASQVPNQKEREELIRKYHADRRDEMVEKYKWVYQRKIGLVNSAKAVKDIGWLQVKILKAQGIASADIGGKSDPFCVVELGNYRLQTHTEYKTLAPEWGKCFTFQVLDIHSILEVTIYDEDRDRKCEFLGKVSIPLLRLKQSERRWYQLKDKKGLGRSRGAVQLEMDLIFNHVKAAIRTFNPREEKYMQEPPKFKIPVMKRNIDRVSKIAEDAVEGGVFLQSCFDWESKPRSIGAFAVFLILVWNFELYMVPLTLLIVFFSKLIICHLVGNMMKDKDDDYVDEDDDDDEDDDKDKTQKDEKLGFKEKLQQIQDICLQVQEGMDMAASMGERVKNTFNWTVPWLSALASIILTIGTVVLYLVPIRYLILAAGINKFTKKLRAPNAIPNNELMDYLSRVPSDKELIQYRELRPDPGIGSMKKNQRA